MAGAQISGNGLHSLRCLPALESLNLRSCQGLGVAGEDPLSALGHLTGNCPRCCRRNRLHVRANGCCELAYQCLPLTLTFVATTVICVCYLGSYAAVSRLPPVRQTSNTFEKSTCSSSTTLTWHPTLTVLYACVKKLTHSAAFGYTWSSNLGAHVA